MEVSRLRLLFLIALAATTLVLVYRSFPRAHVAGRGAVVAAVTVTIFWELARYAFSTYVHASGVYGRFYGSFGIWVAGLVWIYYSSAIFILGAELAAVLSERQA